MKPIQQTIFGNGENGSPRGNCFAACIASILELSLEYTPNFCENDDWRWSTNLFLSRFGFCYLDVILPGDGRDELTRFWGYHIISGNGPRGCRHSVVGYKGKPTFDPHPEGGFLLGNPEDWEYGLLIKVFEEQP